MITRKSRFTCEFCNRRHQSIVELRVHKRRFHLTQGSMCPFCSNIMPDKMISKHVTACQKKNDEANDSYIFSCGPNAEDSVIENLPRLSKPSAEAIQIDWSSLLAHVGQPPPPDIVTINIDLESDPEIVDLSADDDEVDLGNISDNGSHGCSVKANHVAQHDIVDLSSSSGNEAVEKKNQSEKLNHVRVGKVIKSNEKKVVKRKRSKIRTVLEKIIVSENEDDVDLDNDEYSDLDKSSLNPSKSAENCSENTEASTVLKPKRRKMSEDLDTCSVDIDEVVDVEHESKNSSRCNSHDSFRRDSDVDDDGSDENILSNEISGRLHKKKALIRMKRIIESSPSEGSASSDQLNLLSSDESNDSPDESESNSDDSLVLKSKRQKFMLPIRMPQFYSDDSDAESENSVTENPRLCVLSLRNAVENYSTGTKTPEITSVFASPFTNLFLCYIVDPASNDIAPPLPGPTALPLLTFDDDDDVSKLLSFVNLCEVCGLLSKKNLSKHKLSVHTNMDLVHCCFCLCLLPPSLYPLHTSLMCNSRPGLFRYEAKQECILCDPPLEVRSPFLLLWHAIHKHSDEINARANRFMCPECEGTFLDYFFDCHSKLCKAASQVDKALSSLACYSYSANDAIQTVREPKKTKVFKAVDLNDEPSKTNESKSSVEDKECVIIGETSPTENLSVHSTTSKTPTSTRDRLRKVLKSNYQFNVISHHVKQPKTVKQADVTDITGKSNSVEITEIAMSSPSSFKAKGDTRVSNIRKSSSTGPLTTKSKKQNLSPKVRMPPFHTLFLDNIFEPVSPPSLSDVELDDDDDNNDEDINISSSDCKLTDLQINETKETKLTSEFESDSYGRLSESGEKNAIDLKGVDAVSAQCTQFVREEHDDQKSIEKSENSVLVSENTSENRVADVSHLESLPSVNGDSKGTQSVEDSLKRSTCEDEKLLNALDSQRQTGAEEESTQDHRTEKSPTNLETTNNISVSVNNEETVSVDGESTRAGDMNSIEISETENVRISQSAGEDNPSRNAKETNGNDESKSNCTITNADPIVIDVEKSPASLSELICEFCGKDLSKESVMAAHKRRHKNGLRCPLCLSSLPKPLLYCHRRIFCPNLHGQVCWSLNCLLCHVPQQSPFHLLRHALNEHPDHVTMNRDNKPLPSEPERIRCQHCAAPVRPIFLDCHQEMCLRKLRYEMKARPNKSQMEPTDTKESEAADIKDMEYEKTPFSTCSTEGKTVSEDDPENSASPPKLGVVGCDVSGQNGTDLNGHHQNIDDLEDNNDCPVEKLPREDSAMKASGIPADDCLDQENESNEIDKTDPVSNLLSAEIPPAENERSNDDVIAPVSNQEHSIIPATASYENLDPPPMLEDDVIGMEVSQTEIDNSDPTCLYDVSNAIQGNCNSIEDAQNIDDSVLEPTASDEALFDDISEVLEAVLREENGQVVS